MHEIEIQGWSREKHFELFNQFDHPHFSICANVDITLLRRRAREKQHSVTTSVVYVLTRAANEIPELRQRIHSDKVVQYDVVHPSYTILVSEELFSFCSVEYDENFSKFSSSAAGQVEFVKQNPSLEDDPGRDDFLFMSAIPWVSFTSFSHPTHLNPGDSVPRIAWGKFFEVGDRIKMPLDVQVHHALVDGVHVGKYYAAVQALFDKPDYL